MPGIRMNRKAVVGFATVSILSLVIIFYYVFVKEKPCHLGYLHDAGVYRALEYCNTLGSSHVGQEGALSQKEEYKLESVHVIVRHGDRHSMHGIKNYNRLTMPCTIDHDVISMMPIMTSFQKHMTSQDEKHLLHPDGTAFASYSLFPNKESCSVADLTPTGAAQHVRNGLLLKKRYFEKLGLDRAKKDPYEHIQVRSTLWPRCYQSALALMYGLLEDELDIDKLRVQEAADNRMCSKESGLACTCEAIEEGIDWMSATYLESDPNIAELKKSAVRKHMAEVFDVDPEEVPPVGHLFDATMAHVCHVAPLPAHLDKSDNSCVAPWTVGYLHDILAENGRAQAKNKDLLKVAKLKFLPLLTEIKDGMLQQAQGKSKLKFLLYSGHDTTISPLTLVLGFGDGVWPPYASRVVLELYSKTGTDVINESSLFIKVLYNGRDMTPQMSWCRQELTDNLCPYSAFKHYVESGILESLSESSYKSACSK